MVKLGIALLLLSFQAHAVPMTLIYDRAQPAYYQTVFNRFLDWYEKETKTPLRAKLSPDEQKYISYCLDHVSDWSYHMNAETYWNYLRVSLRMEKGHLQTGKIAVGPTTWDEKLQALALRILKHRKINLPAKKSIKDILWLEWDLDRKAFSIYFKDSLGSAAGKIPQPENYADHILIRYQYRGQKAEVSYLASRKEIPLQVRQKYIFYLMVMDVVDVISDGKVQNEIFELKSFDDRFMDDPIKTVANDINHHFRFLADSMIYIDHTNMEIFYP